MRYTTQDEQEIRTAFFSDGLTDEQNLAPYAHLNPNDASLAIIRDNPEGMGYLLDEHWTQDTALVALRNLILYVRYWEETP